MHWLGEGRGGGCVDELVAVKLQFVKLSLWWTCWLLVGGCGMCCVCVLHMCA